MIVDFQLAWTPLATMIRNKILSLGVAIPGSFEFRGQPCLVDRVDVESPSLSSETVTYSIMQGPLTSTPVTGERVLVQVPVVPIIKTVDAVMKAGVEEAKTLANPTIGLFF